MRNRHSHAFAGISMYIPVAQLDGLVNTGRSTRGNAGASLSAPGELDVHLYSWIATRVEYLSGMNGLNTGIHF
jgi:hypothetical protein